MHSGARCSCSGLNRVGPTRAVNIPVGQRNKLSKMERTGRWRSIQVEGDEVGKPLVDTITIHCIYRKTVKEQVKCMLKTTTKTLNDKNNQENKKVRVAAIS